MVRVNALPGRGALATYLLDPESDDGFVTWNLFDAELQPGGEFPVMRVEAPSAPPR
jgi:hypothetical protein